MSLTAPPPRWLNSGATMRALVIYDTITLGEEVAHYGPGLGPPSAAFGQP